MHQLDPIDEHAFTPGLEVITAPDAAGHVRRRIRCRTCGKYSNAPAHRSAESRRLAERRRERTIELRYGTKFGLPQREKRAARPTAPRQHRERPAVDYHPFVDSGRTRQIGPRSYALCETCDSLRNAPRHRSAERVAATAAKVREANAARRAATAQVDVEPELVAIPQPTSAARARRERIVLPTAEMAQLAIAIDAVLALPVERLPWKLRIRLVDARQLIDLPTFPSLASVDVVDEPVVDAPTPLMVDAMPQLRPIERLQTTENTGLALTRGIRNDKMRQLARRAIGQGWVASMTGSGHLALDRGRSRLVVSTTSVGGARGWQNLRAEAKRVGIDVTGL